MKPKSILPKRSLHAVLFAVFALFLSLLLGAAPVFAAGEDDFVTTWNSGVDGVVQIPIVRVDGWNGVSLADYNFTVEWGDGSSNSYTGASVSPSHTYANLNTEHDIRISGSFPAMTFLIGANQLGNASSTNLSRKLTKIKQWGTGQWQTTAYMFLGCENLEADYTDSPDTSLVVNMESMFSGATKFNGSVSFDTSNVTSMQQMFYGATSFNSPVAFDTSNVVDMQLMFYRATSFNQPVDFQTNNVLNLGSMFSGATSFNQPINFNTQNVTSFNGMFSGATSFNQDVSHLDFRAATTFTDSIAFLDNTNLSTVYNDRFIRAMASQLGPSIPKVITSRGLTYCLAAAEHATLVAAGWIFYDTYDCSGLEPTAINFSGPLEILLNASANSILGTLSAISAIPAPEENFVYSLSCDTPAGDEGYFELSGSELLLTQPLDGLAGDELGVCVRVTNAAGQTFDRVFTFALREAALEPSPTPTPNVQPVNTLDQLPASLATLFFASGALFAISRRLRRR